MSAKIVLVFCAQALLYKAIFSQCLNRDAFSTYGFTNPCFGGIPSVSGLDITATSGGNFPINSFSAIPPYGLSVASENVYEGVLAAAGELPFVGSVAVDGVLPTAGAGVVNYGCGTGNTAMVSETIPAAAAFSPAGLTAPFGVAPAAAIAPAAFGVPANYAGFAGCGCGGLY